jgi:hypothetical protein
VASLLPSCRSRGGHPHTARRLPLRLLGVLALLGVGGCDPPPDAPLPTAPAPAAQSREDSVEGFFTDISQSANIDIQVVNGATGERYLVETMVGGLGWIDHDGDGDHDLYVVNGHSDSRNAARPGAESNGLYRNDGGGTFTDVTTEAGVGDRRYGMGVAVGDYDNDGHADLLVTNYGRNTLYHNDGNGAFVDVTETAGIVDKGFNTSAVWFDMDRDGDLDLYVARYLRYEPGVSRRCGENGLRVYCHPRYFPGEPDLLYRNTGDGTFEEIGARAGIDKAGPHEGKGLGVIAFDYDRDGFADVYVANDSTPNFLWRSNGDGTFTDVAHTAGVALSAHGRPEAGMGVDVADVNGDGVSDIYVTNFVSEMNALYLGRPRGLFVESSRRAKLGTTFLPVGFGMQFLDVDLDGDQDIVTANGHVNDLTEKTDAGTGNTYRQRPALYLNDGRGTFEDGSARGGAVFAEAFVGRGLAGADFDNDGDVDVAIATLDRSVILLRNENPTGYRSLRVALAGTRSPRDGYGARVEVDVQGARRVLEYQSGRSYLSAVDPRLVIGLGAAGTVERVRVHWPSGQQQELHDVPAAGGSITITEPR